MPVRPHVLDSQLLAVDELLSKFRASGRTGEAVARWRGDAAALRFHLNHRADRHPPLVAVLGGTGTGKSTIANRLLGANVTATSFRRTFTSGAVAAARDEKAVPEGWLGIEHRVVQPQKTQGPARGEADVLVIVPLGNELTERATIVDTPDLDGDQPLHHAQADRAFRWAQAVVFLVTPEKYQMTELLPYYRLAQRYGVPALYVMNKCEGGEMLEDYRQQLVRGSGQGSGVVGRVEEGGELSSPMLFAVARDDAGWEPPAEANLDALRSALINLRPAEEGSRDQGLGYRVGDLAGRLVDQVIAPLREERKEADRIVAQLRALEAPVAGVDVNPITQQLQRRFQQRSVLYLMGPGRMLERVRQVPGLLVKLPRTAWDLVVRGKPVTLNPPGAGAGGNGEARELPDFSSILKDQLAVVQSRVEDVVRSNRAGDRWIAQDEAAWKADVKLPAEAAAAIAEEELADLRQWLGQRWNGTPRDTAMLQKLLKVLPGGQHMAKWSEAAPYLLAVVVATHHAFFGPVDLMVVGGWSLATWLTEKISNEVSARTRATNRRIGERFAALAHEQIDRVCRWVESRVPAEQALGKLEELSGRLAGEAPT